MKKFFVLILTAVLCFSVMSCTKKEEQIDNPNPSVPLANADDVIMSYEGESISRGLYAFIFTYQKTISLYYNQNLSYSDTVEDTEAFWNSETGNGKLGELTVRDINDHCKMVLLCNKMASEYDVELGEIELEYVEDEFNDLTAAYGGTEGLKDYLKRYGITPDEVEQYFRDKYLIRALRDTLCADGGICEVSDEEVYEEIERSCLKTTHLFLTNAKYDGDASAKAEEVLEALKNGAEMKDFASLSEDSTFKTYPDGTLSPYPEENAYTVTAFNLKADEYAICPYGDGVYIIKKFAFKDEDKESLYDYAFSSLADDRFVAMIEGRYGLVEIDENELSKFDIVTAETIAF